MFKKQWDRCVDHDNVDILDWIHSHFDNDNWHKNFEVTVTMREYEEIENEDGSDTFRVYVDE